MGKNYIKIADFKSDELRGLAYQNNTKREKWYSFKNERLDETEISAFMQKVEQNERLKSQVANESDDIKKLLGYTAAPAATTPEPIVTSASEKENTEYVTQAKAAAQERLAAEKTAEAKTENNKDESAKTADEAYSEVRAAYLKERGYDPKTGKTNGTQSKAAYKAVKKSFKGKGKEYKEAIKQLKYDYKHADARLAAANAMKDAKGTDEYGNVVDPSKLDIDTAKKVRAHAVEYLKAQNNGVLDKREYRALKGNDKNMAARALDWIGGNDSHQKKLRKGIAADNTAAKTRRNERFTIADMKDAIGKRCPFLQENVTANGFTNVTILEAAGLIKEEKDANGKGTGKYDITNLSLLVRGAIGPDATLNDHNDDSMSEVQSIRTDLGIAFEKAGVSKFIDVSKLTDRDLRQLNDFCKYYDDRTHNIVVDTYRGIGIGAIGGAATGSSHLHHTHHAEQTVTLDYKTGTNVNKTQLINQIQKDLTTNGVGDTLVSFVETANGIRVLIKQIDDKEEFIGLARTFLPATLLGTGIGAIVGGAAALAHALLTHKQEKAVIDAIKFNCVDTYEDAVAIVDAQKDLTPDQRRTLYALLLQGVDIVKDDKGIEKARTKEVTNPATGEKECKIAWKLNCCDELNKLVRMGGNGITNAQELDLAAPKVKLQEEKIVKDDCDKKPETKPQPVVQQTVEAEPAYYAFDKDAHMNVRGYSWDSLAGIYDCFPSDTKTAKRMLKVMQGMNESSLTVEDIQELTKLTKGLKVPYLKDSRGNVVYEGGYPKYDVKKTEANLRAAFKDFKFPLGYSYNYVQAAYALCSRVPGDNNNEIIAPLLLYYRDPELTPCHNKKDAKKPTAATHKANTAQRGNAADTSEHYGRIGGKENVQRQSASEQWQFRQDNPNAKHTTVTEIRKDQPEIIGE